MEIVSSNSDKAIDRRHAEAQLSWALRDLAANMLRVIRGAGRPWLFELQAVEFLKACQKLREIDANRPPADVYPEALTWRRNRDWSEGADHLCNMEMLAEESMMAGGLQFVASRLVGQQMQERAGERELYEGFKQIEALREERRREWQKEAKARIALRRAKPIKRKA